jgi:hypothetical protein
MLTGDSGGKTPDASAGFNALVVCQEVAMLLA